MSAFRPWSASRRRCCSARGELVKREVEGEHVDPRLADEAERPALDVRVHERAELAPRSRPRAAATRGTWKSAASGVMSGSRPEPEVVTRSIGTRRGRVLRLQAPRPRRATRSISAALVGPRFEPEEAAAL